ncbi:MAG TPA: CdaR family protein [Candidatus Limiplasma sp.]|nr:CdaR family protein [Candidatus Limiplasma sp.]
MSPHTDHNKQAGTDNPPLQKAFKTYPKRLWAMISNNLQWKVLALVLAVGLWVGLISQDTTLTRERTFTNVPLSVTGSDTLRRNGFIVIEGLEEENAIVKLKVDVPQQEYNDVTYSNYNPRIDLTKISEAGEQSVKVSTTSSSTYGTVSDVSPESIPIIVDEYVTNYRIPVQVNVVGDYPQGYYGTTPTVDVSYVTVSGPESIISQIARVVLTYDVSALSARTGSVQTALPLQYMDSENNELDSTLLEPTSGGVILRTIVVDQDLYPTKSISLNQTLLTTGTPKTGYEIKSVTASPSTIIAAGDETTLSTLQTLFVDAAVDVSDRDTTFTAEVKIDKPDNIVYLNAETVTLIVDIGPIMTTKTYDEISLSITNKPDGMSASSQTTTVAISVTGPMLSMETLRSSRLTAFVSAEGLSAGTYDLPIQLTIDHDDADLFTYTITPQSISVTVSE